MTHASDSLRPMGVWNEKGSSPTPSGNDTFHNALLRSTQAVAVVRNGESLRVRSQGTAIIGDEATNSSGLPLMAFVPPLPLSQLGDPLFLKTHKLQYPYVMGAMANGITSESMVEEAAKAGMVGFFGAGGLSIDRIAQAVDRIQARVGDAAYGFNLIHNPYDPGHEQAVVDLYLKKGVRLVSAAAFMRLTAPLIQFRVTGIHENDAGKIICPNKVIAKVSRSEVARRFFSPPPEKIITQLVSEGKITAREAALSRFIPVAEDLSAEADSGGHTDNRPALALFPTMVALKNEMMAMHNFETPLRVGLGGGIATPESAAAAFSMGAAYILTGSINQSCVEAGTSDTVKDMLCKTEQADVIMAPAADMFEMGVKVQVLKRGTMFALKAAKLYEYYRAYDSLESMPPKLIEELEKKYFHASVDREWAGTSAFFQTRDPKQLQKAERDPKHKMALLFRSYLGRASLWAVNGEPDRMIDYQVWCGPAMGAFNEWVKGSFLEAPHERRVATVALNLLLGASYTIRMNSLRNQGISLADQGVGYTPLNLEAMRPLI